jgi:hypothetical protein
VPVADPAPAAPAAKRATAVPVPIKPSPVIDPEAPIDWSDELVELLIQRRTKNVVYQLIQEETGIPIHALADKWSRVRTERRWQRRIAELEEENRKAKGRKR